MGQFACILFYMDPLDADAPAGCLHIPAFADGMVKLGDLIGLGQVGIKVVLPVKGAVQLDFPVQAEPRLHRQFHRLPV